MRCCVVDRALGGAVEEPTLAVDATPVHATSVAAPRRIPQRTIARSRRERQGLHSGVRTGLILQPMPPGSGIVFESIATGETVPALVDWVDSTGYATTLVRGGMVAKTVEHLMAALHAHGVTNLLVKMHTEVPILDGSAQELCELLAEAGIEEQGATIERSSSTALRRGSGRPGRRASGSSPATRSRCVSPRVPGADRPPGTRSASTAPSRSRARSRPRAFGFVREIETLERMGLAAGGRLNNFILVGDEGVVNAPLRFEDEFVRHKILDIMGDFYLLGRPIRGRIVARKTGHGDNAALLAVLRARFGAAGTA
jgi:UDP-3-O-acyl-N-acetylglucosamine deacetylase